MKNSIMLLALVALIFTSCNNNEEKKEAVVQVPDLTEELQQATDYKDSLIMLMGDIYDGMEQINIQEGLLFNLEQSGENSNRRAEIMANLQTIKERLQQNRELLSELEKKLNSTNDKNGVLAKQIENLKTQITDKDSKIVALETELQNMQTINKELEEKIVTTEEEVKIQTAEKEKAQQETIATENELNKCYYAIGSNKELKNAKLLEKKFLGKTKVMEGEFETSYFTTTDKRNLLSIPCNNKKVKIWTNHPADSYEIVETENELKTIKILDPAKFWSLTNYLIIQEG